jgi:hypothetical protein
VIESQTTLFKAVDEGSDALGERPAMVLEKGVYRGAHYYSLTPMIRIILDLGRLERWPSNLIPDFVDRLLELLPRLDPHGCSLKRRGGFVERLREGTWLGHVAEHVALELRSMAGPRVTRGKTRSVRGKPGVYNVMFAYAIARIASASQIISRLRLGEEPGKAIGSVLAELPEVGGEEADGGAIAIRADGRISWNHNSPDFAVGLISEVMNEPGFWLARAELETTR